MMDSSLRQIFLEFLPHLPEHFLGLLLVLHCNSRLLHLLREWHLPSYPPQSLFPIIPVPFLKPPNLLLFIHPHHYDRMQEVLQHLALVQSRGIDQNQLIIRQDTLHQLAHEFKQNVLDCPSGQLLQLLLILEHLLPQLIIPNNPSHGIHKPLPELPHNIVVGRPSRQPLLLRYLITIYDLNLIVLLDVVHQSAFPACYSPGHPYHPHITDQHIDQVHGGDGEGCGDEGVEVLEDCFAGDVVDREEEEEYHFLGVWVEGFEAGRVEGGGEREQGGEEVEDPERDGAQGED